MKKTFIIVNENGTYGNNLYKIGLNIKSRNTFYSNNNYAKYLNVTKEKIKEIFSKYKIQEIINPSHTLLYTYFYKKEEIKNAIEELESIEIVNKLTNTKHGIKSYHDYKW